MRFARPRAFAVRVGSAVSAIPAVLALLLAPASACRSQVAADAAPRERSRTTSTTPAAPTTPAPASPAPASPAELDPSGLLLVERVVDGDTIVLAGGERVRMLGIDTAEMKHPDAAVRAIAGRARVELESLVEGRRARIVAGMPDEPRDRHDRLLAYVEAPDDLGAKLLALGLARPYPSPHPRAAAYRALASKARDAGLGLWSPQIATTLKLRAEKRTTCAEASAHLGELVEITGRLSAERRSPRVHRLWLTDSTGRLAVIVFPSRYDEISEPLIAEWAEGDVVITGEIGDYKGSPQIVLEDPFQVMP